MADNLEGLVERLNVQVHKLTGTVGALTASVITLSNELDDQRDRARRRLRGVLMLVAVLALLAAGSIFQAYAISNERDARTVAVCENTNVTRDGIRAFIADLLGPDPVDATPAQLDERVRVQALTASRFAPVDCNHIPGG